MSESADALPVRPSGSGRRRLEHDVRRDDILTAAQHLFAHRPYESVSIAEVARAAGTTRTNLHYYFGTKTALYLEVVNHFADIPLPHVVRRESDTVEDTIERVFAHWLDLVESNAETFLGLLGTQTSAPFDVGVTAVLEHSLRAWSNRLLRLIGLRTNDPVGVAAIRAFQALVSAACIQWLREQTLNKDQVRRLLTATLLAISDLHLESPSTD